MLHGRFWFVWAAKATSSTSRCNIEHSTPLVKTVTSIQNICKAMNTEAVYKTMLSEVHTYVHDILSLYLTILITSATSEKTFSALKHVFTYI